jgi:hypothetical protein
MMFGIVLLLVGVVVFENWRLIRMTHRSGYRRAWLSDAYPLCDQEQTSSKVFDGLFKEVKLNRGTPMASANQDS